MRLLLNYKLKNRVATLEDQEEALKKPGWAYRFARYVPGADIRKCEDVACKESEYAYWFAREVSGADIKKCEEAACMRLLQVFQANYDTIPKTIGYKLRNKLATIEDQEEALKDPNWAYWFARDVPGADIKKCEETACKDP